MQSGPSYIAIFTAVIFPESLIGPQPTPGPLKSQRVPIYSKEKRSRQTRCVNCKPPPFVLISMKQMSSCSPKVSKG